MIDEVPTQARSFGVAQAFRQSVRRFPDRVAVKSEDGLCFTYLELNHLARTVAAVLTDHGVRRGDRIAVISEPSPAYVAINLAAAKLGVTLVGVNTRFSARDVAYCVESSRAKLLLYGARFRDLVSESVGLDGTIEAELSDGHQPDAPGSLGHAMNAVDPDAVVETGEAGDIHTVIYTSGTTGRPKGAMISQAAAAVRALRLVSYFQLTGDDAFLGWLPLFHTSGEEPLNATLLSGGRYLTFRRADPHQLVDSIERGDGSWSWLLPGMFAEFLDVADVRGASLRSLRFAGGYGNLLPTRLIDQLVSRGVTFYDLFGQTESSLLVAANRIDATGETEWVKRPTPFIDIEVLGTDGNPTDEPGECVVRGPSVMNGYLNEPDATREAFRDGWLHTGDVLQKTDDGGLRFVDRKKYLIKTGGENVYPLEVEIAIASHPEVSEVCVTAVPDERWGETVKAFIVRRPDSSVTAEEIDQHCQEHLARYKRPRLFEFLRTDEVPRSATGKIRRADLSARPVQDSQRVMTAKDA